MIQSINKLPGVSHNYLRDHEYNLWFAMTVGPGQSLEREIANLAARVGVDDYLILPALRRFKIGVDFDLGHVPGIEPKLLSGLADTLVRVPVTHGKVFGWYDNEYGSYTNMMGDLTVHVHRTLD